MRVLLSLVIVISIWWIVSSTSHVAAQAPPSVLADGLLTLTELPPGFRDVSPAPQQFPPIEGLDTRNLAYERDPGPISVISSIARAADSRQAMEVFRLMVDVAVSNGVQTLPVAPLGDEAAGLTAPASSASGAAHRYMFRKDAYIVAVTLFGPTGSVTLDDAVGLAITVSARVDRALAAAPGSSPTFASGAPDPTPRGVAQPRATATPPSRPAVRSATIASEATFDAPSISGDILLGGFSGIVAMDTSGSRFAILTDRGPNVFFRGRNEAVFAVPDFSPRILMVTIEGDTARLTDSIPLRLPEGFINPHTGTREITGISTGDHDGPGYTMSRERVPYDPNGVDSEGLARDPRDGSFWVADEYGPSILHAAADGTIIQRFVPEGLNLDAPGENVVELLPRSFLKRKANRGFEGIAISPDGTRVYAIMQSALANPDKKTGEASRVHRIVALDTSTSVVTLEGVYLYLAESASRVRSPEQDDVKIGDMAAVSATRLLVAERDSREGGPHRMVYTVDVSGATNVRSRESVGGKTLEQLTDSDLKKAGIEFVSKEPLVDLASLGFRSEKFEGLAIVDETTLVITGDNDFGLAEADKNGQIELTSVPSRISIVRLPKAIR